MMSGRKALYSAADLSLGAHLGDQRVGDLEIGIDVLDVVVVLQRSDQAQQLLALLVVDGNRVLRLPGERGLARLAELRLERPGNLPQRVGGRVDLVAGLAGDYVLGARLDRRF